MRRSNSQPHKQMSEPKVKFFRGNPIPTFGFPLVVLTIQTFATQTKPGLRRGAYFFLWAQNNKDVQVQKKALTIKVPQSDEFIFSRLEEMVKEEIQKEILSAKTNLHPVAQNTSISLSEINEEDFCFYVAQHELVSQVYEICQPFTNYGSLRKDLPNLEFIEANWVIKEDKRF
jgi:hypothetical protein